eukprot:Colp12_sorted_trinity150504_noHs@1101
MKAHLLSAVTALLLVLDTCAALHDIRSYGAIPNNSSNTVAFSNGDAITKAISAANSDPHDRVVLIPAGVFYFMPIYSSQLNDITIQIDGDLIASGDLTAWPHLENGKVLDAITIEDSTNVQIVGSGLMDGQGFDWWVAVIFRKMADHRPRFLSMRRCENIRMDGFRMKNAAMFHIYLFDVNNVDIRNINIDVDVFKQKSLLEKAGHLLDMLPTFPLNTDGIDPAGSNIFIKNVTIRNYDDAVAVKPIGNDGTKAKCSENITVVDSTVYLGVGMTIGSVPPNPNGHCVRNVTFKNIVFHQPFKAIYVKTNPGENGYGNIEHILYEDIKINNPIWWAIYIGPQQQKQPDGGGPGCMLYPILKNCPTQPRITVRDIILRNVSIHNGLIPPGIIRCDPANPCTDIVFENVIDDRWLVAGRDGFITENVYGSVTKVSPDPHFKPMSEYPGKKDGY